MEYSWSNSCKHFYRNIVFFRIIAANVNIVIVHWIITNRLVFLLLTSEEVGVLTINRQDTCIPNLQSQILSPNFLQKFQSTTTQMLIVKYQDWKEKSFNFTDWHMKKCRRALRVRLQLFSQEGCAAALWLFGWEALWLIAAVRMLTQVLLHLLSAGPPENSHLLATGLCLSPPHTHTHTTHTQHTHTHTHTQGEHSSLWVF